MLGCWRWERTSKSVHTASFPHLIWPQIRRRTRMYTELRSRMSRGDGMVTCMPNRSLLRMSVLMNASLCFTAMLAEPKTLAERGAYAAIAEATL